MSLKAAHIFNGLLWFSPLLILRAWTWYHDPEKFVLQAPIYAVGIGVVICLILAYNVIEKFQKPRLGWAMVVIGIIAVLFPYGRVL
ncbi:hypothetical protein [Tritonibacter mobilis]|uniref:hypothetical protein n=1 Tax=Tritonibacter mobilis TaxID=379347 RepID=UPI000806A9B0|nr:hypothetical protein [Tritonibacter mobilis]